MDQQESTKPKRNYGWVILGLCFGNLIVEGGVTRSQPVFLPALRQGFGGSAAMTAAIFSASGFFGGLAAPVLGKILDIIGPKYMFPLAGIVILLGWWACSMVNHMWQLFIFYSLISALGHISIGSFAYEIDAPIIKIKKIKNLLNSLKVFIWDNFLNFFIW